MKLDNPIYYEDQNRETKKCEGSFSLVWRPLVAKYFPDTEMIYWVPEYMDTLRSRKKKEEEDNGNDSYEIYRKTQPDIVDLNFKYDKKYNDEQSKQNHGQSRIEQELSPSSKKRNILSPLTIIPELLSPRCNRAFNYSRNSQVIPESPESQKITITFSPESVMSYTSLDDQLKISNFRSPAAVRKLYATSSNFFHFDKTPPERNSINILGRKFNLSRRHRVVSEVTDDFVYHRPNAIGDLAHTNSPSYINQIELQRINHRQSGDPLPTPPPLSIWESYGNSGHIYMNDTKILKGRIPDRKVLDGYLTSQDDHNLHRNLDYEPLGMRVLHNNNSNSTIDQAIEEKDNIYRLNLRLYFCFIILMLILGVVLILVILRVLVF